MNLAALFFLIVLPASYLVVGFIESDLFAMLMSVQ